MVAWQKDREESVFGVGGKYMKLYFRIWEFGTFEK